MFCWLETYYCIPLTFFDEWRYYRLFNVFLSHIIPGSCPDTTTVSEKKIQFNYIHGRIIVIYNMKINDEIAGIRYQSGHWKRILGVNNGELDGEWICISNVEN